MRAAIRPLAVAVFVNFITIGAAVLLMGIVEVLYWRPSNPLEKISLFQSNQFILT
jgi:hypothetical protein